MWTPDIRTLFLLLFLVNAFLTLMLFTFWKTQKTYYGFGTWMLGLLVISCGYFLYMLRGSVSDFLSIIIANILIALSVIMRVDSSRRYFWSKPISPIFYCILIPFTGLFLYYTYSVDSVLLRSLISNVIIVPCLIITGILAIRSQDPENRSLRSGFAATFIVVAILLTVRIISWLITPQNQSLFSTDLVNSFYFIVPIITDILGTGFFIMLNMTRSQKDLRVSEDKFRQLFTRMPSAVAIYDAVDDGEDFIFKDFNIAAEKIEGIKKDDLVGKRVTQVFPGVKDFGIFVVFQRVWRTGQPEFVPEALYRDEHAFGTWRESWVYKLASGEVVAIYHDITERKQAEEQLKHFNEELESQVRSRTVELERLNILLRDEVIQRTGAEERVLKSLKERELLLSEVHHRVGNNLQIMLSLIRLQSQNIKDPGLLDTMGDFQNRIRAMAYVHERMYRAEDISRIDLSEICTFVGTSLFKSYKVDPQHIRLNVEMKDLQVGIDYAIPISLIINELVSNAIKHAFPHGTSGEIIIAGRREADTLVLSVRDTGIGIPEDLDWEGSTQSLGHRLVVSLVEQLNGTIELDRTTGTAFKIVVKEKP
jgi:PAS domain S-box-containing protein